MAIPSLSELGGLAVILGSFITGAAVVDSRYQTKNDAAKESKQYYSAEAGIRHEDVSIQIHTTLNMMLIEERVRRYTETTVPDEVQEEMNKMIAQLNSINKLLEQRSTQKEPRG